MIFYDGDTQIKFFIQRDVPQDVMQELTKIIQEQGGRIEEKVPRQGYVLIAPGTAEAHRLRSCWFSPDRPGRFFVPYTFVEACKNAGAHLKQIFTEGGMPIPIHIHSSFCNPNARASLSDRIIHSGGDPNAPLTSARVILADPNTPIFQTLIKSNENKPGVFVESYMWVKKCIESGVVAYTPVVFKNPGGRRKGEERTQFSDDDDRLLCQWIAQKIPFKETGGRTGNKLYQQLIDLGDEDGYNWVRRHTWQSWRERYKKNAERLDVTIAAIVAELKLEPGEKGQYGYVREKHPKKRKPGVKDEQDEMALREELEALAAQRPLSVPANIPFPPELMPTPIPAASSEPRREEEEDWPILIGNLKPPAWASGKRHASIEAEDHPAKRPRTNSSAAPEQLHVVDTGLRKIAQETKFTIEEVQAFFDKTGEMEVTRNRFQAMRAMISKMFPE
ncbi:hypothetical protein CYLTODRAFT_6905 [Cylindrobasidium torrendii FP15055 ss-10]|uniref:DNA-binding protein RAP1 n=1 Tax=Cylindrobasidium torrendii FP15055 ss-10 TaxID=1314674 RepID=A0A0D7BQT4_9AGAR|nr:hypothetical protein CYLTODRAFT_6905 [Cylindrobasidium torrendii FP15055 ss-10]